MNQHLEADSREARRGPRTGTRVVLAALVLAGLAGAYLAGRGTFRSAASPTGAARQATQYHCPMHPAVVSDKPGDCPICGMKLVPLEPARSTPAAPQAPPQAPPQARRYYCPMDPTVVSDKPGDCPICGMKLVPLEEAMPDAVAGPATRTMYRSSMNPGEVSDKPGKDSMGMEMVPFQVTVGGEPTPPGLAAVAITPAARQRMGLTLGTVEQRALARALRTSARIVTDETRLYHVNVKVDGYVETLFAATTGQHVQKGEPLLSIYSPMLVSTQQEYLAALKGGAGLAAAARKRLTLWDVSEEQIKRLEATGEVERVVTLLAPVDGWIIERDISAGHRVMAGEQLLVLCDLSSVWADSDIYQSDLPFVKLGMPVEVEVSAAPGETFAGKVSFISPTLDPETRTVKVRMDVPNPHLLLKPEMYAVARLTFELGEKLAVPEAAVMLSGEHAYAFRDAGDGRLVPTEVKLGARCGSWFELLDGLAAGDRVVTSANFLVDSESSMRAALEALTGK
jgi:membrane fusion protein, copper/silver efflux system